MLPKEASDGSCWPGSGTPPITDAEFARLARWLGGATGIHLTPTKRPLVTSRLARRLRENNLLTFTEYLKRVDSDPSEHQIAIDLLTTNETYFFREPRHFEFLDALLQRIASQGPLRVWSAACSTGEEAYSIAMLMDSRLRMRPWEIVGTDISTRVLDAARAGHYKLERTDGIPREMLQTYCLKGTGRHDGTLLVQRTLRERVHFLHANLTSNLPDLGQFDVIFLRNVMIYFDLETKRKVVDALLRHLRPGGYLLVGHSETLNEITRAVQLVAPSIYRKP